MNRPSNEPPAIRAAREAAALAMTRRQQSTERDRLISYQAAVMTRQIEQHLAKEAER